MLIKRGQQRRKRIRLVYVANVRLPTEKAHGFQMMKMCEAFSENGCEVILLRPHRFQERKDLRKADPFDYYAVKRGFRICTIPFPDPLRLEGILPAPGFRLLHAAGIALWGLISALIARLLRADIYFTRDPACAFSLALLGLSPIFEAHSVGRGVRRLAKSRRAVNGIAMVVAVTGQIRRMLIELGFSEGSVVVQPDSVDLSMYEKLPGKEECREKLGLPPEAIIIGFIGRFIVMGEERGVPELTRAVGEVCRRVGEKVILLCVGGPLDNVRHYLDLAAKSGIAEGNALFFDRVPSAEVPCWIRSLDVAVIPYPPNIHYSLFVSPMKAFEYMAAGVPVVASDLPSLREILSDGKNAVLVKAGCPEEIAGGIMRIIEDQALRESLMSEMSKEVVKYTWTKRANRIIEEALRRNVGQ